MRIFAVSSTSIVYNTLLCVIHSVRFRVIRAESFKLRSLRRSPVFNHTYTFFFWIYKLLKIPPLQKSVLQRRLKILKIFLLSENKCGTFVDVNLMDVLVCQKNPLIISLYIDIHIYIYILHKYIYTHSFIYIHICMKYVYIIYIYIYICIYI